MRLCESAGGHRPQVRFPFLDLRLSHLELGHVLEPGHGLELDRAALLRHQPQDRGRHLSLPSLLPVALPVPSGRLVPLDYSGETPVLAVKLQELFGATSTPTVLEGRLPVTVHLLTPAGRPAAITQDLAGFWERGYAEVRRDLRGRYPKHPWPDDPRQAIATALTKARLAQKG